MKLCKLRKVHCSPPLVGEDNSMVFTSHSVPFLATRDLWSLVSWNGEQHDFDRNYLVGICQKWEVGKCQKTVVGKCPRKLSLLENVRNFFVGK